MYFTELFKNDKNTTMTNGYNGRHIKENAFYIIPASDSIIPKNNNIIHMNKQ